MARLPTIGGDSGDWGAVLNEFLETAHNADGTLRLDVKSVADLKALNVATLTDKQQALVAGYYAPGDGGGGQFYYDAAASDADDGGTILAPSAGSGRWKRVYSGAVNVRWFGAKGDGVTDDTTAVTAAIAFSAATTRPVVSFPTGNFSVSYLDINANINIVGAGREATTITIRGYSTYVSLKYGVLLRGSGIGSGYVSLSGLHIYVQSTEFAQIGVLITKRALLTDVRVRNAPGDGIYLRSVDQSTEAPYFSMFDTVWSSHNGGSGIKLTENANGCQFINCEFNTNGQHGVHGVYVSNGQPVTLVNTHIIGGQASYNQKHGIYLENGWHYHISGIYAEYNSAADGGNPVTGAYKNLHMGGASYSYVNLGAQGTAASNFASCITINSATNNFVGYGGYTLQTGAALPLGFVNTGTGGNITFNGASDCQHSVLFREGTTDRTRIRYDGTLNATLLEGWNGSAWIEIYRFTATGSAGHYGATAVYRQNVTGSRADGTALANLLVALANLGLITNSTSN